MPISRLTKCPIIQFYLEMQEKYWISVSTPQQSWTKIFNFSGSKPGSRLDILVRTVPYIRP